MIQRSLPLFLLALLAVSPLQGRDGVPRVLNGIDVLREQNFERLAGKRVGLITNHTGLAADGRTTIDLLAKSGVCKLVALFSPEHGISGNLDSQVDSSVDTSRGTPIYSLYGDTKKPTADMLKGIDVLVFDIQDIFCRLPRRKIARRDR